MSYSFEPGNNVKKSKAFSIMANIREASYIEKGSVITFEGKRCDVLSIRRIDIGNGFVTVHGRCKEVVV